MRGEIRKCPICGTAIKRGKLMCLAHWTMVPREIQRKVNATWREFNRAESGIPKRMAIRAYADAHDAAIAAVLALTAATEGTA